MSPHVAVIGAGVIGLSTAVLAQEMIPGLQVTLISQDFSPNTTGDGAAGMWMPYCLKDTSDDVLLRWSASTYKYILDLWKSEDAAAVGAGLAPQFRLSTMPEGVKNITGATWSQVPLSYIVLDKKQLNAILPPHKKNIYSAGAVFITMLLEPTRFLPYLMKKFKKNGGHVEHRKVHSLDEFVGGKYSVVINCTGVQAYHVAGDKSVTPIRGQVMRVRAPWVTHGLLEEDGSGNYIIPNSEAVILGGTKQEGNWNIGINAQDSENIHKGCCNLLPGLQDAEIVQEWTGLRPGRRYIRLENEVLKNNKGESLKSIIQQHLIESLQISHVFCCFHSDASCPSVKYVQGQAMYLRLLGGHVPQKGNLVLATSHHWTASKRVIMEQTRKKIDYSRLFRKLFAGQTCQQKGEF